MKVEKLFEAIGSDFYTGIPDSLLKPLCNYLIDVFGINPKHHIIAANEGNCTALAAGYYLATGRIPVVYMQNSGEGNMINPAASLLNDKVYAIPMVFIIGWRGEPGVYDEPQHVYQGIVTIKLLEDMGIESFIISEDTSEDELNEVMGHFKTLLGEGRDVAFVVRKGALDYSGHIDYKNDCTMGREEIIKHIVGVSGEDPIICTTGKASRELFENRAASGKSHKYDFLTVGSMGHSSSIALGIAVNKPNQKIWCIDGDGAALMHMGSMAVIGASHPRNLVHIIINNGAHETVGGMPTVASGLDFAAISKSCGYPYAVRVDSFETLDKELKDAKERRQLSLIEVKCGIGARKDLGRPTTTALENKKIFMEYIQKLK